jgi:hypothetical protein
MGRRPDGQLERKNESEGFRDIHQDSKSTYRQQEHIQGESVLCVEDAAMMDVRAPRRRDDHRTSDNEGRPNISAKSASPAQGISRPTVQ